MPQCKKCGNVVAVTEAKEGLCKDCLGVENISELSKKEELEPKDQEQNNGIDTWGIVSLVMGVIGFLILPIVMGPIGLVCGLASKKSAFGIIGIILSSIQILYVVGSLIMVASVLK